MTAGERDGQETAPVVASTGPRTSRTRAELDDEFSAFAAQHGRDLLRTAWLLCGDAHRAEELTQQALVRTYAAWSRTQDPLAYCRRVLANLRVDTWRRRRREVLTAPEDLPERDMIRVGSDENARTEDRDQLVRALAVLTPRQRRIVVLRHMVGLPEAEVAAELGVSIGTVKSTASRGLATLRAALTEPATTSSQEDAR